MMEHVIVTGATGMVGATMIEQMLADDFTSESGNYRM